MTLDVNVILQRLPNSIKGFCIYNNDLTYTIVLNTNLNYEMQLKTYFHELSHIVRNDFELESNVDFIELTTHS